MASEVCNHSPGGTPRQGQSMVGSSKKQLAVFHPHAMVCWPPPLNLVENVSRDVHTPLLTPPCPQSVPDTRASHDCIFMPWFPWNVGCRRKATSQPQLHIVKEKQTFGYLSHRNTHAWQWLCRSWEQCLPACRSLHRSALFSLLIGVGQWSVLCQLYFK